MDNDIHQIAKLNTFNEQEHKAAIEQVTMQGIRLFCLADTEDTPATRQKLYKLVREGVLNTPGHEGGFESFDEFSEHLFEPFYWRSAKSQFLASDGEAWIGLSSLTLNGHENAAFGLTVTARPYWRLGIARALKVLALSYAKERGVQQVTTRNHSSNQPMLTLNRALGFQVIKTKE